MLFSILLELAAFALFGALAFVFHDRKDQPLIRKDLVDDAIYFLISLLIYGQLVGWLYAHVQAPAPARFVGRWPLWAQAGAVLVLYDALQYGLHRAFHGNALWRYHAVHHSAEEIDILTSVRIHPVNFLAYVGLPTALLLLAGFPPSAFLVLAPINFAMSCLTHANLNWTYGPFRYVVASPMYHRWHHAIVEGSVARNFAPNFPLWDLMLGTFYMPKGERPVAYGAPGVPPHLAAQMAFPFRKGAAEPVAAPAPASV
jgi:sterol desaturase/sphingolipid hydroxylase (fatty acid hydroxylase superfamily)